ncbi:SCO4848 family membrane protein [Jidongwangia harbinensis]|uniref:SCO4848 family membrane protein n=1 Tax=Jidongwangia harbinensis TaxID=2878561 RepID=UPI001CD93784|nr:hypothetical protein [Jidongwangia harbinensis]MCA2213870.1 hypothetical protein [Jidongwangia harbinensis]
MVITRRWAAFLVAVGVWNWAIWPGFISRTLRDDRAFAAGSPTAFFWVHALIIGGSLALGTVAGVLGIRAWRANRRTEGSTVAPAGVPKD